MTSAGLGVWLAIEGSPLLKLYHALTVECLMEVNVAPAVTKTLGQQDDIIRQHKLSCLRVSDSIKAKLNSVKVTCVTVCKDLVWVGTSAGVLLQLPLPHVTHSTSKQQLQQLPKIQG